MVGKCFPKSHTVEEEFRFFLSSEIFKPEERKDFVNAKLNQWSFIANNGVPAHNYIMLIRTAPLASLKVSCIVSYIVHVG